MHDISWSAARFVLSGLWTFHACYAPLCIVCDFPSFAGWTHSHWRSGRIDEQTDRPLPPTLRVPWATAGAETKPADTTANSYVPATTIYNLSPTGTSRKHLRSYCEDSDSSDSISDS